MSPACEAPGLRFRLLNSGLQHLQQSRASLSVLASVWTPRGATLDNASGIFFCVVYLHLQLETNLTNFGQDFGVKIHDFKDDQIDQLPYISLGSIPRLDL